VSIRPILIVGVIAVSVLPRQARAQQPPATPATAVTNPFSVTTVKRVPVSKAVFGDAALIVNARDDGFIEVAAAGPTKTVFLQLRTMAARAWVDSTARMMRAKPRRSKEPKTFRADIAEHGTSATMAVTRTVTAGQSAYALAFSDGPTGAFTVPIESSEADVFLAIMRKAVAQSEKLLEKPDTTTRVDSAPPAPKKKPAAKRAASPSAKTSGSDTSAKTKTGQPSPTTSKPAPSTSKPSATTPKPATAAATPAKPA
jgi:hypothetical protein